jgi:hypothetical protein
MLHGCSDEEAIECTKFDDRWKVSLDLEPEERPFAKSTLQEFRARLLLNETAEKVFLLKSLEVAKSFGLLSGSSLKSVLDTTPVIGRGAVKDTYNLIADGIKNLARVFAHSTDRRLSSIIERLELTRYFSEETSLKGGAEIDWSDDQARRDFLNGLVADAKRLLAEARDAVDKVSEKREKPLTAAINLLDRLVVQDVEPDPSDPDNKVRIKDGTTKDRVISVTDPEMKHGRKSSSKRFDGHKLATAADPATGLITAVKVLPGNAPDDQGSLALVEATEANTGMVVDVSVGDCAYGGGKNRKQFHDAGRPLVTKVPLVNDPFHKTNFKIDLENDCVTCPAGRTCSDFVEVSAGKGQPRVKQFTFALTICQECPHKEQCLHSKEKKGSRTVTIHPQEDLLQEARAAQNTPEFRQHMKDRQQAEHAYAHLMHYGMRQARYFGQAKTKVQAMITCGLLNFLIAFAFSLNPSSAAPSSLNDVLSLGTQECPPVPGQSWDRDEDSGVEDLVIGRQTPGPESGTIRPNGVRGGPDAAAPHKTQGAPQ